jgi:DNA primase
MDNFHDFIEQVRDANPIEDVIQEDGYPLKGHKTMRGTRKDCDSLNVRTDWQRAWWFSQNWQGDVFAWVMRQKGVEFMDAVEMLARRAGMQMPKFQKVNEVELRRNRATADIFSVAAVVFHRWLMGDKDKGIEPDAEALKYVHGRGWCDETIQASMTGFSGRKTDWQIKDMAGEFDLFGLDNRSPAAVAVMGFQGDVAEWARAQGILNDPEFDKGWIEKGRIHGLMDTPGVIYAHQKPLGKVIYLSRRQLPGHDEIDGRKWKSFNPQKVLVGPKQFYFNHIYQIKEPCVMVEGQGDAITWGQWKQVSIALCGIVGNLENRSSEEQERIMQMVHKLKKNHPALYYAPDNDEAGQKAIKAVGKLFGPTVQVVRWSRVVTRKDKEKTEESPAMIVEENIDA